MARISIDLKLSDLEPTDRIEGYTADSLVRFAMVVNEAGIKDSDLKEFCHNADWIAEIMRKDFEHAMHQAFIDSLPPEAIRESKQCETDTL